MLLREVSYVRPGTLEEAISQLAGNPGARPLAGGQTLVNVMKARAAAPDVLVDLADLEELRQIGFSSDGLLEIGAMVTYAQLASSAEEFFVGVYMTAVGEGELLTKVSVPPSKGAGDGFSGLTIGRHGTYVVDAAATVGEGGVRIALGCVAAVPVRATAMEEKLAGGDFSEAVVKQAAEGLGAALDPPSDVHGSADYRRQLAEVAAVRAVLQAASRRKGA